MGSYQHLIDEDFKKAKSLITKLTAVTAEERASLPSGSLPLPVSALQQCKGLAFIFSTKGGIGLSFEQGHGFVIAKLPRETTDPNIAPHTWSAPLFLDVFAGSVGLSLGFTDIESVIVLNSLEAVEAFINTQVTLDTEFNATAGDKVDVSLPGNAVNVRKLNISDHSETFSIAKGAMVDVSVSGMGYSVDTNINPGIYGHDYTPSAVLSGQHNPPVGAEDLYSVLDKAYFRSS